MTVKELIKGCVHEDRKCQKEIFRRYAGKMLTICRRYARHHMEAEDLLQDAFIKVFDNIEKFKYKGSFEGWIRRIVVNTAIRNYQKSSFQKEQIGMEDYVHQTIEPEVFSYLHEEELLGLVANLPTGYRVVFNLFAIEGYNHKEISHMLGIGESTSRSQLMKARKMLQFQVLELQKVTA